MTTLITTKTQLCNMLSEIINIYPTLTVSTLTSGTQDIKSATKKALVETEFNAILIKEVNPEISEKLMTIYNNHSNNLKRELNGKKCECCNLPEEYCQSAPFYQAAVIDGTYELQMKQAI